MSEEEGKSVGQNDDEIQLESDNEEVTHENTEEAVTEKEKSEDDTLNSRQKRLFDIRLRLNASRKANHASVRQEQASLRVNAQKRKGVKRRKREEKEDDEEEGWMMETTALASEEWNERKEKKRKKGSKFTGREVFSKEAMYASYEGRIERIEAAKPGEEPVDRLISDMNKQYERNEKWSRRRKVDEDKFVDFVNERNRKFNARVEREFGKFTTHIKQNLERGTAL